IAELFYAGQTDATVRQAEAWLWRWGGQVSTSAFLDMLAERVHPRILVDKSPSTARNLEAMQRAFAMCPKARFIHLLRHPRGRCESVLKARDRKKEKGKGGKGKSPWGKFPPPPPAPGEEPEPPPPEGHFDPQWSWYTLNHDIMTFLAGVPA